MRKVKPKNRLVNRNGRWYENGRMLRKKDYIYHYSTHEQSYILTDNDKYRLNQIVYI